MYVCRHVCTYVHMYIYFCERLSGSESAFSVGRGLAKPCARSLHGPKQMEQQAEREARFTEACYNTKE